jgi:hypothetical protein
MHADVYNYSILWACPIVEDSKNNYNNMHTRIPHRCKRECLLKLSQGRDSFPGVEPSRQDWVAPCREHSNCSSGKSRIKGAPARYAPDSCRCTVHEARPRDSDSCQPCLGAWRPNRAVATSVTNLIAAHHIPGPCVMEAAGIIHLVTMSTHRLY